MTTPAGEEHDASPIPLVDLVAQHREIAAEVDAGFDRVMQSGGFIGGDDVAAFEREYSAFTGAAHCIGVGNGTDALELALRALGIGPGDEVVVPANTFVATAEAVVTAGATVVLADCDHATLLVHPDAVKAAITARTPAIMPVHLYGQLAPMTALQEVADAAGVPLVEDAAQSQGARQEGRGAGTFGVVAGTSFYPGKNLGAYGDAGAVLVNDDGLAERVRLLANHGSPAKYQHVVSGVNSRLDALQAVVLRAKLTRLERWNESRRQAAVRYDEMLAGFDDVTTPTTAEGNLHVWHLYVVQVPADQRDRIIASMNAAGIGAGIHYPTPIHLLPAFADLGKGTGDFPVAEATAQAILTLPLHPHITADQQARVIDTLAEALR